MSPFKSGRSQGQRVCGHCHAANDADARECWLCERPIYRRLTPEPGPWTDARPEPPPVGCLVVAGVALLDVVLLAMAPGLGILLLVTAVPASLASEFHARRRLRHGRPMSELARAGWFLFWMIVLPFLLALALFIAVMVLCGGGGVFG